MSAKPEKLLVIGHGWPEPLATAAGKRMLQLLEFWKDLGTTIIFASAASKTEFSYDLGQLGIQEIPISLNNESFDLMIAELNPDIVMFDRFMTEEQYGWRVAEQLPNCIRILNTEDLHSLREVRRAHLNQSQADLSKEWLKADITKRELASIYRSDLSFVISSYEVFWLQEHAGVSMELLFYLPFMYNPLGMSAKANIPGFEERKDFVFVGNGKHKPNLDAIEWLKDDLWPEIRKELPQVSVHVYGAYLPERILKLNDPDSGFLVHGWVEDIQGVLLNTRINLVPLRFGAGLKGKLVEAMRCGTPSITTQIGLEGILKENEMRNSAIEENRDFVEKAVRIYCEKQEWEEHQVAEIKIFDKLFEKQIHYSKLKDHIAYLFAHLEDHRLKNVMGQILQHQTMKSTKYMAKWIEAKNKA
ncbi:MAG: glycosyltransferase [Flavobacteriaceae bacterium]